MTTFIEDKPLRARLNQVIKQSGAFGSSAAESSPTGDKKATEDFSQTLETAIRLLSTLLASAHRNERDYMPSEWHDAVDEAREFLAAFNAV